MDGDIPFLLDEAFEQGEDRLGTGSRNMFHDVAAYRGVGIEELDVDPVEQESGGPSTPDDAAPEQPDVRDAELLGRLCRCA